MAEVLLEQKQPAMLLTSDRSADVAMGLAAWLDAAPVGHIMRV